MKNYSQINTEKDYLNTYTNSLSESDTFWTETIKNYTWSKAPTKISSGDFNNVDIKWFEDGELNITTNALDRHLETTPNKTAIIFEPNNPNDKTITYTYKEVHQKVCQISELMTRRNIKKGDVVCLYMSMIPELLFSVLACARIGAIHSVVFGGFSAKALQDRIEDCKAKLVITNDSGLRGSKKIPIKNTVDTALKNSTEKPQVMVWRHSKEDINFNKETDFWANDLLDSNITSFTPETMMAEDPLFILYTSGSTGKPKGLLHTTAGYMVWSSETFKNVFQMKDPNDIFWCSADIGWITGHSYISYAPLINGQTQVMFEGVPTWPDPSRFWQVIEKHNVSHFYTAPTAIRALQACDISYTKKNNLSSLKVLGSVGEPINEEAWLWYKKEIGNDECPIVDTWWQTETGGIMISNLAGVTSEKPTYATTPLPGVKPQLLNQESKVLEGATEGQLCISKPWPGMARSIYGDHKRFIETYFSTHKGHYFTGDGAKRDENGSFRIIGRIDDVVNVSGHRIGTAEVENIIDEHEQVIEAAVIGAQHEIKGQCLVGYVIPSKETTSTDGDLLKNVNLMLTEHLGAIGKLDRLIQVPALPKTRSGKIMRRILRKIADGETEFGDISTLINPEAVEEILVKIRK